MAQKSTKDRWRDAIATEGEATEGSTEAVREYDPQEAAERAARAQFDTFREDLGEDFQRLRGSQASRGRIRSGMGFEEEDRFLRDRLDRLDRALTTRAVQVSGQELQKQGLMSQNRGRYLDLLSGQLDREVARENANRSMLAGLLSGGAYAAGQIVPAL